LIYPGRQQQQQKHTFCYDKKGAQEKTQREEDAWLVRSFDIYGVDYPSTNYYFPYGMTPVAAAAGALSAILTSPLIVDAAYPVPLSEN
jgi:hypothetical protein